MHVSSALKEVDTRGIEQAAVESKAVETQVKSTPGKASIMYMGAAVKEPGHTASSSPMKEMVETLQAVFSLVGMAVNFFRSLFSPTPKPATVCPFKPSPVAPGPARPTTINPSPVNPFPVSSGWTPWKKAG